MNPFHSLREYEVFVYSLREQFPSITHSTLVVAQRGACMATVTGELHFAYNYRLVIRERLTLESVPLRIKRYGYEVWHGNEKLYWYDSQPHPNDLTLAATDPHHKHIPPDIKHHRIPAPNLSFTKPNLPFLINEIEQALCDYSLSTSATLNEVGAILRGSMK